MCKKILLSGYFGFDNLGDEAILYSIIDKLIKNENVEITVLSKNPEKTKNKFGVRAVDRMKLSTVLKEIKKCDIFVSGGGSLLQDVTSKRSVYYYLGLMYLAKVIFGKKVMVYSQGIGPLTNEKNRKNTAKILNKVDILNVRDADSKDELIDIGVRNNIFVTADTVFTLDNIDEEYGKTILSKYAKDKANIVGISVRKWKDYDRNTIDEIAKFVESHKSENIEFILLPFHHPDDLEISKSILEKTKSDNLHIIDRELDEREMLSVIKNVDIMISMRLHAGIFSVVCGAYPLLISYDPKLDSLSKEINVREILDISTLKAEDLSVMFDDILLNLKNKKLIINSERKNIYKKAMEGISLLEGLLN